MIFAESIKMCLMIDNKDNTSSSEYPTVLKWYEIVMLGKKKPAEQKNQYYFGIFQWYSALKFINISTLNK